MIEKQDYGPEKANILDGEASSLFAFSSLEDYQKSQKGIEMKIQGVMLEFFADKEGYGIKDLKVSKEKASRIISSLKGYIGDYSDIYATEVINGRLILYSQKEGEKDAIIIDIQTGNIVNETVEVLHNQKFETISSLNKLSLKATKIIDAMENIFKENDKEIFGTIDNTDVLQDEIKDENGESLKGKNLLELQKIFEEVLKQYEGQRSQLYEKAQQQSDKQILKIKEKYFEYIVGVGDIYEGGAKLFHKTEVQLDKLVEDIVLNKSPKDLLIYLAELHIKIDNNNYQSISVEESYLFSMKKLHRKVFERLKDQDVSDKEFLALAKMITGRPFMVDNIDIAGNIDNNLKDQGLSNEIILHIMGREGGIMDKINKDGNIVIEDRKIGNLHPSEIVSDTIEILSKKSGQKGEALLKIINFDDIIDLQETEYKKLTVEQKIKVSTLIRLQEKLQSTHKINSLKQFGEIMMEVGDEANKEVIDEFNDHLDATLFDWDGKDSSDYNLTGLQAEIFDLYQDINGNGLFDFSDNSLGYTKTGGKILASIVVGVATAPVVMAAGGGIIVTGAVVGLTATAASIVLNPQGFDSKVEAVTGLTSEFALGAATGALGGVLIKGIGFNGRRMLLRGLRYKLPFKSGISQGFGVEGARVLSRGGAINSGIFIGDLLFLGIGVEIMRQAWANNIFHKDSVIKK